VTLLTVSYAAMESATAATTSEKRYVELITAGLSIVGV
jgi:hypothetical protein